MKPALLFCTLLIWTALASTGAVPDLSWATLMNEGKIPAGELVGEALKLENSSEQPKTFKLTICRNPASRLPPMPLTDK